MYSVINIHVRWADAIFTNTFMMYALFRSFSFPLYLVFRLFTGLFTYFHIDRLRFCYYNPRDTNSNGIKRKNILESESESRAFPIAEHINIYTYKRNGTHVFYEMANREMIIIYVIELLLRHGIRNPNIIQNKYSRLFCLIWAKTERGLKSVRLESISPKRRCAFRLVIHKMDNLMFCFFGIWYNQKETVFLNPFLSINNI